MKTQKNIGKVYLIGAGPGDPGLLTVKAAACLRKADVILYDRLVSREILKYGKLGVVLQYVGKEKGKMFPQEKINDLLLNYARQGKTVVRLKGGDPFIFGRGQEEMAFLVSNGMACEVVPGVSSFYAVPETCGVPLTFRGLASGFLVVTGHEDPAKKNDQVDFGQIAKFQGTIVIMMGLSNLKDITSELMENGKDRATLAAVISNGTTRKQKMVLGTLGDIAEKAENFKAPAICVIGDVVGAAFRLNPKLKPLASKRYLTTASENLNRDVARDLEGLGASVDCLPLIRIVPNQDTTVLDGVIENVQTFDWLVFTSRHGVYYFLKRFFCLKGKKEDLAGRIACVGSGTAAEFAKHGIPVDLMPEKFTTRDLALALAAQGVSGKRIALLRTVLTRDSLKGILARSGAQITDCVVYNVEEAWNKKPLLKAVAKNPDGIFFLSPKSTQVFFDSVPKRIQDRLKKRSSFLSIGPVTTRVLRRRGVATVKSAAEHTVRGLVDLCLKESAR